MVCIHTYKQKNYCGIKHSIFGLRFQVDHGKNFRLECRIHGSWQAGLHSPWIWATLSYIKYLQPLTLHRPPYESRLLRAFGTPQSPPVFVIRPDGLLTHTGLVARYLCVLACRHAVHIAAGQHFHSKIRPAKGVLSFFIFSWLSASPLPARSHLWLPYDSTSPQPRAVLTPHTRRPGCRRP